MSAPRRPVAPRTSAAREVDESRTTGSAPRSGQPARDPAPRPARTQRPPQAPRSSAAASPWTPTSSQAVESRTAKPFAKRPASPAPRSPAPRTPATRTPATPRTGVPQQSVPRPAAPRPVPSRARATPSSVPRSSTSRPSSTRPGGGGRGTSERRPGRAESVQQRVPRLFTVRALVMLVVASIAFILVFPTLRQYLDQQVHLEQLRAEVAQAERNNEELEAELDRWSDPKFVEAQARERLAFVMPGERALRVADPEIIPEQTLAADGAEAGPAVGSDDPTRPWFAQLWDSVQVAGAAGTGTPGQSAGSADPSPTGDNGTAPADGTEAAEPTTGTDADGASTP